MSVKSRRQKTEGSSYSQGDLQEQNVVSSSVRRVNIFNGRTSGHSESTVSATGYAHTDVVMYLVMSVYQLSGIF